MTPSKTLSKALGRTIAADGTSVVLAHGEGAKERGQFVVVNVPLNTPIGLAELRYANQPAPARDVVETVSTFREVMFSVHVYRDLPNDGATAEDLAERIRLRIQQTSFRQAMLAYGLAFSAVTPVRDVTTALDAAQEPRAQFDVYFNTIQTLAEVILSIESIDIHASYQGAFKEHDAIIQVRNP